jgi:nucleotide-binding universal stress UspA family protein
MRGLPGWLVAFQKSRFVQTTRQEARAMFKKILWATDGSDAADLALPVVQRLAAENDAEILVFHGVIAAVGPRGGYPMYVDEDERQAKIKEQVAELSDSGLTAELHVFAGDSMHGPAQDIAEMARREGVDLIVAGTQGHTRLGGFLLGSVTQQLLTHAPCPVLVVPTAVAVTAA